MKVRINASALQNVLNSLHDTDCGTVVLPYSAPDGIRTLSFVRHHAGLSGIDQWVLEVDIVKRPKK